MANPAFNRAIKAPRTRAEALADVQLHRQGIGKKQFGRRDIRTK
jgi:hypothetical protein